MRRKSSKSLKDFYMFVSVISSVSAFANAEPEERMHIHTNALIAARDEDEPYKSNAKTFLMLFDFFDSDGDTMQFYMDLITYEFSSFGLSPKILHDVEFFSTASYDDLIISTDDMQDAFLISRHKGSKEIHTAWLRFSYYHMNALNRIYNKRVQFADVFKSNTYTLQSSDYGHEFVSFDLTANDKKWLSGITVETGFGGLYRGNHEISTLVRKDSIYSTAGIRYGVKHTFENSRRSKGCKEIKRYRAVYAAAHDMDIADPIFSTMTIDHIDGNCSNDCAGNLQLVSSGMNSHLRHLRERYFDVYFARPQNHKLT